jgi:outer membrane immunogenic protein
MAGLGFIALAVAQPAVAADAPIPRKALAPVVAPIFNWSGFYLGINGGWARYVAYPGGQLVGCGGFGGTCVQPGGDGWTLGGHVGWNWQAPGSPLVIGAEADLNWIDASAVAPCANPAFNCGTSVDWQGSLRGRLGLAAGKFLFYVTGGVAFSELNGFTQLGAVTFPDSTSRTGWIAGLGVDVAMNQHWFVGFEWLHAKYGAKNHFYDVPYGAIPLTTDLARVRLTFRP